MGPVLVLLAAVIVAIPLGMLYSYLLKWIPFIYLHFLITFGYAFAFGFLTMLMLKLGKVRNGPVAVLCGITVGLIAWYFNWNGHVHTLVSGVPWVLTPRQVWAVVKILYAKGSWAIGFYNHDPLTGVPLAIVWLVEGIAIVGITTLVGYGSFDSTPYCEQHNCWLDQEKVMDKLDAFTLPAHLAAFQVGDIAPLEEARPRVPASGRFARLTLRHSPACDDVCTLSIANIDVAPDKNGKPVEKATPLMTNLLVPKSMFEYLETFDHPTAHVRC
jgi:hypothetical protein